MAEKTVGYVELEWTCKRCGTVNPGTQKTCSSCGAAMEAQEQFQAPAMQTLITDAGKLAQAAADPDVHCPYCGARNAAGTQTCTQCGGDLKDADKRQAGQVMGAYTTAPAPDIICPSCKTPNSAGSERCKYCGGSLAAREAEPVKPAATVQGKSGKATSRIVILAVVAVAILCVGAAALIMLSLRTKEQVGVVQSVQWQRSVEIAEQRPVEYESWEDQIPTGVERGSCKQKYRTTQNEPEPGAEEVCGTAYIVDQGSGVGKVVQDCEYHIYDDWCTYTQMDWVVVESPSLRGNDLSPEWPAVPLSQGQREGDRSETYQVVFESNGDEYTYTVDSVQDFSQFTPGSQWVITVNAFGSITEAQEK